MNWARLSPKMCWADLGPTKIWYFSSGPDPAQKAGLGQDPPGPATKTGGGNYFPPTPECRMLFVLHAEKEKINTRGKKSYLARGRRWLAALLAVLWRRSMVVSWLTDGDSKQRRCCLKRRREGFFLFPSPPFPLLFFCYCISSSFYYVFFLFHPLFQAFLSPPLGFPNGFLCFDSLSLNPIPFFFVSSPSLVCSLLSLICSPFSLAFPLSLRFLFFHFFSLLSVLSFRVFLPLLFLPSFSVLGSIYRAKGVAFYCSHGEQPAGRPLGATAKVRLPPVF